MQRYQRVEAFLQNVLEKDPCNRDAKNLLAVVTFLQRHAPRIDGATTIPHEFNGSGLPANVILFRPKI